MLFYYSNVVLDCYPHTKWLDSKFVFKTKPGREMHQMLVNQVHHKSHAPDAFKCFNLIHQIHIKGDLILI